MSAGTIFLGLVFVGFLFFATQWGARRGPGSFKIDFIYLFLFIGVGIRLYPDLW
jgi:hypothetical protein